MWALEPSLAWSCIDRAAAGRTQAMHRSPALPQPFRGNCSKSAPIFGPKLARVEPMMEIVTPSELTGLPEVVARYLRFMGVVDQPRVWAFRCRWRGRFRTRPGQAWSPCKAWQYNTRIHLARDCRIRIRFGHAGQAVGLVRTRG